MPHSGEENVICYECNNISPKDDSGLTCPRCGSDFIEIVEDNDEDHPMDDFPSETSSPPPLPPFSSHPSRSARSPLDDSRYSIFNHNPWQNVDDDNDAQDNGNGSRVSRHSYRSPDGRFTMTRTTITSGMPGGRRRSMGSPEPLANPDPLVQTIGSFFQEIAGAYGNRGRGAFTPDREDPWSEDNSGSPRGNFNSSAQTRGDFGGDNFLRPPGLFPRDTNGRQPANMPLTNFNDIFDILRNEANPEGMTSRNGQVHILGAASGNPLSLLASMLTAGRMGGDAVYSQEELDHVISQLIDQNTNQGAPPATDTAIQSLPKTKISPEMLGSEGRAECSICMDPVELGTEVTQLPCKHWFHGECIESWLKQHNTCPHCRRGINEGTDEPLGSRNNPMVIPSSPPPQSPNRQSSNDHSGSPYYRSRPMSFGSSSTFSGNGPGPRSSFSAAPEQDRNNPSQEESTSPGGGISNWFRSRFGSG